MFDIGWTEMMVIGVVALIVVGPKDLPGLFRSVGQFVGKAKGMAREFSSAMNAAADESGVSEINKTIRAAANPQKFGVDKLREASKSAVKSTVKEGSETAALKSKLSDERAATAEKMDKAMAKAAENRLAKEAGQKVGDTAPEATTTTPPKKVAAKKAAPKKTSSKAAAPKKTAAPKKAAPKTAAKKAAPENAAATPKASASKDAK